jgi:hypothetical protein
LQGEQLCWFSSELSTFNLPLLHVTSNERKRFPPVQKKFSLLLLLNPREHVSFYTDCKIPPAGLKGLVLSTQDIELTPTALHQLSQQLLG